MPGGPTTLHIVEQGPGVLAAGAGWGAVFFFKFSSRLSYLPFLMPHLLGDGWTGGTKHHKPPQNTTNHHKTPQTTSQTTTNHSKAQINHHTHPLNKYSDPNLGRKCCGLECEVQKGYDIVKFVTANIH